MPGSFVMSFMKANAYQVGCIFNSSYSSDSHVSLTVSNEVPEHPVVSPVSGAIFERRLIEKYILDNGIDPVSGKELTADMLIDVKGMNNC